MSSSQHEAIITRFQTAESIWKPAYDHKRSSMRKQLHTATHKQASYWYAQGMITEHEWRAYQLAFVWCAVRFGGDAANSQERYFHKMGFAALLRRRDRAVKLWTQFCKGEKS